MNTLNDHGDHETVLRTVACGEPQLLQTKTINVLHIEDNPFVAKIVDKLLSHRVVGNYMVHHASTFAEGLVLARNKPVDVVLLDLNLPDTSGLEGIRYIMEALPNKPVVILSSQADIVTRRQAYALGVVAFLDKAQMSAAAIEGCLYAALQICRHSSDISKINTYTENQCGNTVALIARILHLHHPTTVEHAFRVAETASTIARAMRLSKSHIDAVHAAGVIHDIGKIILSTDHILDNKKVLSIDDWQLIREHSQAAYDVLSSVEWQWPIPDIVLQHHERMDGSGYPRGISGNKIMIEARILAVADAFDARSYRRDRTHNYGCTIALDHLREGRGTLYDPAVVDACCSIYEGVEGIKKMGEPNTTTGRTSLLIVDDEPAMGRSIKRALLGQGGISVYIAFDGITGIKMACEHTPGLILLDVRMPGMDGLEVLQSLKKDPQTKSIPVIMLTAVDDDITRQKALFAKAEDYLMKPVPPDQLKKLISSRLHANG